MKPSPIHLESATGTAPRRWALFALVMAAGLFAGCANLPMNLPAARAETLATLRNANLPLMRVGEFRLAEGRPADMDRKISLRGSSMLPPTKGSFSVYLADTFAAELAAAGFLDPASTTVISGELLDSDADAAIGTGTAKLSARVRVQHQGQTRYDREWTEEDRWESSFMGAIAIPMAADRYKALYGRLVGRVLADEGFRKALQRP